MGRGGASDITAAATRRGTGGLQRLPHDQNNRPLQTLLSLVRDGQLDLSPEFQRPSVWTDEQRVNLIKSVMQGLPIGAVFLNQRDWAEPLRCIDGKQRLEALVGFANDEFAVPADWFDDERNGDLPSIKPEHADQDEVRWSELTDLGYHRIERFPLATYETKLPSAEEERELYQRINFAGTAHQVADSADENSRVDELRDQLETFRAELMAVEEGFRPYWMIRKLDEALTELDHASETPRMRAARILQRMEDEIDSMGGSSKEDSPLYPQIERALKLARD